MFGRVDRAGADKSNWVAREEGSEIKKLKNGYSSMGSFPFIVIPACRAPSRLDRHSLEPASLRSVPLHLALAGATGSRCAVQFGSGCCVCPASWRGMHNWDPFVA